MIFTRLLFFFFQAEDGIRDLTVTGVQTCALPIWPMRPLALRGSCPISGNSPARRGRMGRYVRRRLIQMVPLLFGISLLIFLIIQAAPVRPDAIFLENRLFIDPSVIHAFGQRLGLDQPVAVQYERWVTRVLSRD